MNKNAKKEVIKVLGYVGMGLGFVASVMSNYTERKQSEEYIDEQIRLRLNEHYNNNDEENESYCEEV